MVSNQVINSDSNYKFMKSMVEGILKSDKKSLGVIFLPYSKNIRYMPDGFFDKWADRLKVILMPSPSMKTLQATFYNSEFMFMKYRENFINVTINNVQEIGAQISRMMGIFDDTNPITVTYNHYTIHPTLPYPMRAYTHLRLLQMLGNYLSDIPVFNTKYHWQMMKDNLEEFKLHHWKEEISKKVKFVPIPVLDDEMKKFYDKNAKFDYDPDNVIFYYNHRLQNYKRWDITFAIFDEMWKKHKNFEVWVSYNSGDNTTEISKKPYVKVMKTHKHEDYYKLLKTPHFNTTNTTHETFCIAIAESALLGGIPIVPRSTTFPELIGEDYPFMFKSVTEQRQIIENILSGNYGAEYLNDIKQKVRKKYSIYTSTNMGKKLVQIIKEKLNDKAKSIWKSLKKKQVFIKIIKKYKNKWVNLTKFWHEYRKYGNLGQQAMPPWKMMFLIENFDHDLKFIKQTPHVKFNSEAIIWES